MDGQEVRMKQSLPTQFMIEKRVFCPKVADYCFTILNDAIVEIKSQFGKDVFAIYTDNEAKMRELALKEYPAVLTYGCSAHYMSLLEKYIGNPIILKQTLKIQKYFRNVHRSHGLLKEKRGACHSCPIKHVGTRRINV